MEVIALSIAIFFCPVQLHNSVPPYFYINSPLMAQPIIAEEVETTETEEVEEVIEPEEEALIYELPDLEDSSMKTYMDYTAITDASSAQYKMQQQAYTDEYGLRKIGEYYCVALGSGFGTKIGSKYLITLDSGEQFKAILGDQKADQHTDASHRYMAASNGQGNIVEFLVETRYLENMARVMGDISYISHGKFEGNIVEIKELPDEETDTSN